MTGKQRAALRRIRNRELAKRDRENRCVMCKRSLSDIAFIQWGDVRRFCSDACLKEMNDQELVKAMLKPLVSRT